MRNPFRRQTEAPAPSLRERAADLRNRLVRPSQPAVAAAEPPPLKAALADDLDPVLSAIAAAGRAREDLETFQRLIEGRRLTPEELARERVLSRAWIGAKAASFTAAPTTAAGRRALVEHVKQSVEDDWGPDWRDKARGDEFGDEFLALYMITVDSPEDLSAPSEPINLAAADMFELRQIREAAGTISDVVGAMTWQGSHRLADGPYGNARHTVSGEWLVKLADALCCVISAAEREARRRIPASTRDQEHRLAMLAVSTIENGDAAETAAFARELLAMVEP